MRAARAAAAAILLALALWPELSRYRAERTLRAATNALRYVITHPGELSDPPAVLENTALAAQACAAPLPGDPRPRLLEGSAWLVRGDAERALAVYRSGLALGERAELDLNLGRAYERLGREEDARAAFVRAAWISPQLLGAMLPDAAAVAYAEVARLDALLAAGGLAAPPPLPGPPLSR